jgi:hypothetical protein
VIVEGLLSDWRAVREWSFEHLASKCGDAQAVVDSYTSKRTQQVTFRTFIDMLHGGCLPDRKADLPARAALHGRLPAPYEFRRNLWREDFREHCEVEF